MQDEYNQFGNLLMDAIKADRKNILEVLKRNGLMVGENIPDLTLFYVVRDAMGKSETFKKDLYSVLTGYIMNSSNQNNNIMENNMYLNVNGNDPILNSTTVATTAPAKAPSEWSFGSIFSKVTQLGDLGLKYVQTEADKAKAEAEKAKAIAAGKISENQTQLPVTPAQKSNTTLYVVLGVVLLASVGGYVYLKNRNKV